MTYKPRDLQAFDAKMKEINATKETNPDILRRMIEIERDQATEIQVKLSEESNRLRDLNTELLEALKAIEIAYDSAEWMDHVAEKMRIVRAAIAKAEGRS